MGNVSKTGIVTGTGIVNPNIMSRYATAGGTGNAPGSTASGGRTQYYGDYGIIIPAAEAADTYFTVYMKQTLVQNTVYTISCCASGLLSGSYYNFPLFAQSNSAMGQLIINHNGICFLTFTMTYTGSQPAATADSETVYRCFLDDNGRNIASGQGPITLTHFKLEEGSIPTPWIPCDTDPIYVADHSSMFEIDDLCKIHKNGNIQAREFIEI